MGLATTSATSFAASLVFSVRVLHPKPILRMVTRAQVFFIIFQVGICHKVIHLSPKLVIVFFLLQLVRMHSSHKVELLISSHPLDLIEEDSFLKTDVVIQQRFKRS